MIASMLTPDTVTLKNVPNLADVSLLIRILRNHGVDTALDGKRANGNGHGYLGDTLHLTARDIVDTTAPYDMVRRMRASFWVLGPLLAREHEARVSLPGGCAIGTRPVDLHLLGMQALGAEISLDGGYVVAKAPGGLRGGVVTFPKVSVGATHNVMMAATMAKGETVLENAACEPEVADVASCLNKMGARIEGAGTATIVIQGVDYLEGATHTVLPDRIETGTYAMAVGAAGGDVLLDGARADLLPGVLDVLREAGLDIAETNRGLHVARNGAGLKPVNVATAPYPRLPNRFAGAAHGADVPRRRSVANPRDDLRKPLHACAGTGPARCGYFRIWRHGEGPRRPGAARRRSDGNGPARLRFARHRRADGRRRDHRKPRLSPGSWLRAARREAWVLRSGHRTPSFMRENRTAFELQLALKQAERR